MRCIIIEDNVEIRELLRGMLRDSFPFVEVIEETGLVSEAIKLIETHQPALWLADIQLEDGSIFDLFRQIPEAWHKHAAIVFITAFGTFDYVYNAMKLSGVDYLVKPVDPHQFKDAIRKALDKLSMNQMSLQVEQFRSLVQEKEHEMGVHKVPFYVSRGAIEYLDANQILYLEGEDNITRVHVLGRNSFVSTRNLGFYKDLLVSHNHFLQVSKKYIANMDNVVKFLPADGELHFVNQEVILVSRRGGQLVSDFFRKFFE